MTIILKTNGKVFSGWLSAQIERSLDAISGHFSISYTDVWNGQENSWMLKAGDVCTVEIEKEVIITGIIDTVSVNLTSSERNLKVTGRDKTGLLVDSGTLTHQKTFKGQSLKKMAESLGAPFGIAVTSTSSVADKTIDNVSYQYQETIWETINRLSIYQGVLAYPDARGGIIFSDIASDSTVSEKLDETKNILEIETRTDASKKFQKYIVISHTGTSDNKVTTTRAEAVDNSVKEPRAKIITTSKKTDKNGAQARANWEMAMAVAKSFFANVTVVGWKNSEGRLWEINTMANLHAPSCGINGTFLIESTVFSLDSENGMTTRLRLVLRDSYKPQPDRNKTEDGVES